MFWRDDRSIGMGSLLQFKQFMCTNILTVRAWLLMSSLTHSTQHDCSVLFAMDEKWWGKTWQFFCLHSLESFFFFFIANQIKRLQFFLLSTHSTAQLSRENFFESRLQVFCDTSQFLHFSLFKKTLIHNDDTWLKFLICITRKKRSKIPYRNISHADDCELSCVDDVTWEHTYFFLKLWVDYDFATACSRWWWCCKMNLFIFLSHGGGLWENYELHKNSHSGKWFISWRIN